MMMIVINSTIPPANEQNSKHRWLHITDQVAMRNELLVLLPLNVGDRLNTSGTFFKGSLKLITFLIPAS